jgi:hypothetical protein
MPDLDQEEMEQFHYKKVTQSEYRGGRSNIKSEEKYLDCSLKKVNFSKESDKAILKSLITEELDHMISILLPENLHDEVKKGNVYPDVYKRLGI